MLLFHKFCKITPLLLSKWRKKTSKTWRVCSWTNKITRPFPIGPQIFYSPNRQTKKSSPAFANLWLLLVAFDKGERLHSAVAFENFGAFIDTDLVPPKNSSGAKLFKENDVIFIGHVLNLVLRLSLLCLLNEVGMCFVSTRSPGAFSIYKKFRKISIGNSGNFRLGKERSICHKFHSFTSPSPSLHQKKQMPW